MSLGFEDCKVFVSTVDSQSSAEGGIIIQVVGELSNRGGPWRKFAQTFFLAEQPNGYFVLNDIFRYIKEESDEDETAAVSEEAAAAPSSTSQQGASSITNNQQEVSYDQLNNASIVGGQQQQSSSSSSAAPAAAHQDFELAQQHGAPADAAGVTVAPPTEAHQEDARANLEELASGQAEQQQVVELHEDLTQEQLDSSAAAQQQQSQVNGDRAEPEASTSAAEPVETAEEPQATKEESPAATPAPAASKSAPAAETAPPARQEPPKPSAPKTWASLAATGQSKWRPQVMAATSGVTSSLATSSAGASRSSTPAGPSDNNNKASSGEASSQSPKNDQGFQTQTGRGQNKQQQQSQQQNNNESRKFTNKETPWSIILENVTEDVSHGMLRSRLGEAFAHSTGTGSRKEHAKIAYLDIDRRNSVAYVDFEEEAAQTKAVQVGVLKINDLEITITEGKGNRRNAAGLGTGKMGPGAGQGGKGRGQGGPNRGGPREGAPQRSQRGGRGGGAVAKQ